MLALTGVIATRRKDKLPKGFSYPLGAEAISHALVGVPQFNVMTITFSWQDTFWASEYKARIKARGTLNILEVRFWREWTIFVHALQAEDCQSAREQLAPAALQNLRECLMKTVLEPQFFEWKANYDLAKKSLRAD